MASSLDRDTGWREQTKPGEAKETQRSVISFRPPRGRPEIKIKTVEKKNSMLLLLLSHSSPPSPSVSRAQEEIIHRDRSGAYRGVARASVIGVRVGREREQEMEQRRRRHRCRRARPPLERPDVSPFAALSRALHSVFVPSLVAARRITLDGDSRLATELAEELSKRENGALFVSFFISASAEKDEEKKQSFSFFLLSFHLRPSFSCFSLLPPDERLASGGSARSRGGKGKVGRREKREEEEEEEEAEREKEQAAERPLRRVAKTEKLARPHFEKKTFALL